MQHTQLVSPRNARSHSPRPDLHIEQNRQLAREFAHDRSAVLLIRLDTAIRRTALALAGWFGRH